jgi:hypothetical protein
MVANLQCLCMCTVLCHCQFNQLIIVYKLSPSVYKLPPLQQYMDIDTTTAYCTVIVCIATCHFAQPIRKPGLHVLYYNLLPARNS